jgi:hypothetical protein
MVNIDSIPERVRWRSALSFAEIRPPEVRPSRRRSHGAQHIVGRQVRTKRQMLACLDQGEGRIVRSDEVQSLAIPVEDAAVVCVVNPRGILQHAGKYRLKITRKTADDPQHLSGCRLLLPSFI